MASGTAESASKVLETPTPEVSLQQQLEQIEAAVSEAHGIIDNIAPRPSEPSSEGGEEVAVSAEACGYRTIAAAQGLIGRLKDISQRVGVL